MKITSLTSRARSLRRCDSPRSFLQAFSSTRVLAGLAALALTGLGLSSALAQVVYNEAVSGDLPNSGLTPASIAVHAGSNLVMGTTGRAAATDRDYFTITVPIGLSLKAIVEQAGTQAGGVSFFGIQVGPQVTISTAATVADGLLGWTHYSPTDTALDIFPLLQPASNGSTGFSGSLGAGTYSFWIQDFTAGAYNYAFDLQLAPVGSSPVPEPSTYAAAGGALLLGLALRRRLAKRSTATVVAPKALV